MFGTLGRDLVDTHCCLSVLLLFLLENWTLEVVLSLSTEIDSVMRL